MLCRRVELPRMMQGVYYPELQLQLLRAGERGAVSSAECTQQMITPTCIVAV